MTILLNTIFILFTGIWFVRFWVEMDVPEKYRVSRFFQNFFWNDFFNLWNKSDAQHYLDLAEKGYVNCTEVTEWSGSEEHLFLVFFPLYPWIVRFFHFFVNNYAVSAFAVSDFHRKPCVLRA